MSVVGTMEKDCGVAPTVYFLKGVEDGKGTVP